VKKFKFPRSITYYHLVDRQVSDLLDAIRDGALYDYEFKGGVGAETDIGWAPPADFSDDLYLEHGDAMLLNLRIERKVLPAALVKREVEREIEKFFRENGYQPGRKLRKEIKEDTRFRLLSAAPSVYKDVRVLIDISGNRLLIDATSSGHCSEVLRKLIQLLPGNSADLVRAPQENFKQPVSEALDKWVIGDDPSGFEIGNRAKFVLRGDRNVTYTATDATRLAMRNLANVCRCTSLALTWQERVSFVLTDGLQIKSIKLLDVTSDNDQADEEWRFKNDFVLFVGEMSRTISSLEKQLAEVVGRRDEFEDSNDIDDEDL